MAPSSAATIICQTPFRRALELAAPKPHAFGRQPSNHDLARDFGGHHRGWGGNARFPIRDKRTDAAWSVCLRPPIGVTLGGVDLMCCRAATTHLLAAPALQWLCRWEKSRFETGS